MRVEWESPARESRETGVPCPGGWRRKEPRRPSPPPASPPPRTPPDPRARPLASLPGLLAGPARESAASIREGPSCRSRRGVAGWWGGGAWSERSHPARVVPRGVRAWAQNLCPETRPPAPPSSPHDGRFLVPFPVATMAEEQPQVELFVKVRASSRPFRTPAGSAPSASLRPDPSPFLPAAHPSFYNLYPNLRSLGREGGWFRRGRQLTWQRKNSRLNPGKFVKVQVAISRKNHTVAKGEGSWGRGHTLREGRRRRVAR